MTAAAPPSVASIMQSGVVTVGPADPIGRARELMLGLGVHGLPVVDDDGGVVGMVTSSDLVEEWPYGEPVDTIMTSPVLTIDHEASAAEAAAMMVAERVHHLVVTRGGHPTAIVSSFDLLRVLAAEVDRA